MATIRKKRVVSKPKVEKPVAKEVEKESGEEYKMIADALTQASARTAKLLEDIRDQMNLQRLENAQPPVEWVFDVVRDDNGYIKTIRATAPDNKKVLN